MEKIFPKLISATPAKYFGIYARFSDGTSGTVNLRSDIFSAGEMTRPLREPAYFNRLKIGQFGDVVWPNGFDFCPIRCILKLSARITPISSRGNSDFYHYAVG